MIENGAGIAGPQLVEKPLGVRGPQCSSQWLLRVAAKAASFNALAHWAFASLLPPQVALGSAPRRF